MASTMTRPGMTDDSGTPASPVGDGTLVDKAFMDSVMNGVDGMWSGATQVFDGVATHSGLGTHLVSAGGAGLNIWRVRNTSDGTDRGGSVEVGNSADADLGRLQAYAPSFTETGAIKQNGVALRALGAGGLSLSAEHASGDVRLYANGTTKLATFDGDTIALSGGVAGAQALAGVLSASVNTTPVGTDANTSEKDLHTFSLPAGTLASDGQAIRVTYYGTFGANGNTKTIRTYFGATKVGHVSYTANDRGWLVDFVIVRTGAATQQAISIGSAGGTGQANSYQEPSETLSGAVTIKITGQNGTASANDIICKGSFVEFLP